MADEKITFEQFFETVDETNKPFVEQLHNYMLENGCKVKFEEKKNGYLASYKVGKPPKAVMNFLFRKQGMLTRIYGEGLDAYRDFLNTLPAEMVSSIEKAGICKRIVENTCSPKCMGYDFTIGKERYQKCRYGCFEFLITTQSTPYIKSFIENELKERKTA